MKNICEWENCEQSGDFKAPIEKDNSKNYRWLCEEHIKLFNKSWNYFEGMNQNEIENFIKSDITWHRPTQKFGSSDNFFNILWNNALNDKFNFFKQEKIVNNFTDRKLSEKDKDAFKECIDQMSKILMKLNFDMIASIESRGFLFASALCYNLSKPLILMRKKIIFETLP